MVGVLKYQVFAQVGPLRGFFKCWIPLTAVVEHLTTEQ